MRSGFTLIELSIVLVIIGLIVGGILTGRDLIDAASQRVQIAQIEKYNTAVRTFQGKYGYLPGDIPDPYASNFGFQPRGQYQAEGDGNGIIEGVNGNGVNNHYGLYQISGETPMVWVDLSTAGLIDGSFSTASPNSKPGSDVTGAALNNWFPAAKLGQGNYVYVYYPQAGYNPMANFWGISAITDNHMNGNFDSTPNVSVQQAYNIDKKIDDGLPQSGNVKATYANYVIHSYIIWASGGGIEGAYSGTAIAASNTTCYDNGNSTSNTFKYSMSYNGGSGLNCALSFKFQ